MNQKHHISWPSTDVKVIHSSLEMSLSHWADSKSQNSDDLSATLHPYYKFHILNFSLCSSQPRPWDPLEEVRRTDFTQSRDGRVSPAPVQRTVWGQWHVPVRGGELQRKGLPHRTRFCRRWRVHHDSLVLLKHFCEYSRSMNESFTQSLYQRH